MSICLACNKMRDRNSALRAAAKKEAIVNVIA